MNTPSYSAKGIPTHRVYTLHLNFSIKLLKIHKVFNILTQLIPNHIKNSIYLPINIKKERF